jgi:hypothetical protein
MPAFLIPVVMWVVQFLRDKSFALTMVGVFVVLWALTWPHWPL